MKIISTFRDFYDSALQFGHDEHIKYLRKTEEFPVKESPLYIRTWRFPYKPDGTRTTFWETGITATPILICGKIYHFNNGDLLNPLGGISNNKKYGTFNPMGQRDKRWLDRENLPEYTDDYFLDLHRQYNAPVLMVDSDPDGRNPTVITNPRLNQYGLQKHFNPFVLYQEIEMFVGAYLGHQPEMVTIGNNDKIVKAGFDLRDSFRHRK